jgi:alkaline phosphatase D
MIDRRTFLKGFLALSGCFLASAQLRPLPARAAVGDGAVRFAEGVASGDPMPDAITLWTRAKIPSEPNASQDLTLQLAAQPDFKETLVEHQVRALPETDHTVRVFVDGLKPDRIYYYRFLAARGGTSRIGRTRTAPAADSGRTVTIACTSCQNYEIGFYQGWRRMIVDDEAAAPDQLIDLVLQVGDFIYEGAGYHVPDVDFQRVHKGANALLDSNGNPRRVPPFPSGGVPGDYADKAAKTVEDFRLLYRTYLQDPNLQDARARWPFVCTWDDHEFADNSWQGHTNFGARQSGRLAANQAWFEYIPAALSNARAEAGIAPGAHDFKAADVQDNPFGGPGQPRPETEPGNQKAIASLAIYRTLSFGKHVNLLVTDVRSYRSGPPQPKWWLDKHLGGKAVPNAMGLVATLDAGRDANDGKPPVTISVDGKVYPNPRFSEPPGTMLGRDQLHWLKGSLVSSDKTWKLCVSGVPMTGLTFDFDAVFWKSVPRVMLSADTWTGYPGERAEPGRCGCRRHEW